MSELQLELHTVYLALGSNLGDRLENLRSALKVLPPAVRVAACSQVYSTPPWGYTDQPEYLNQVVQAQTRLSPHDLLSYLKEIESHLGRQPSFRYGPRLIDLDILLYDDLVLDTPELQIPHPRLAQRAFVLIPLTDLNPHLLHPTLRRSVSELLADVDAQGVLPLTTLEKELCSETG